MFSKGFTLIEMSIVLVIIGLIIGGILKGQEVIESGRLKRTITGFEQIEAAVLTFSDKYGALPGDYRLAHARIAGVADVPSICTVPGAAGAGSGNGNGVIGNSPTGQGIGAASVAQNVAAENCERGLAFIHMNLANLLGQNSASADNTSNNKFGDGSALPPAGYPSVGYSIAHGPYSFGSDQTTGHWLRASKVALQGANPTARNAFTGKRIFQMDIKLDDGQPQTGLFRSIGSTGAGTIEGADCLNGTAYATLGNDIGCLALLRIGN